MEVDLEFYRGKRVFVTGHTGFKGTWLCKILEMAGADLIGYALLSPTEEGAKSFKQSGVEAGMQSILGDVRDYISLKKVFDQCQPEIVFHLAAQAIVREGYKNPIDTYSTNVMGTVNVLECVRMNPCAQSFLNVTTDKVYANQEQSNKLYTENDPLDGFDPYSNSKSCSELVTHSYKKSFFANHHVAISTARAGNVIGGGDFAKDRIIPDCIRAAYAGQNINVRNPYSVRPYQHVLEPLYVYLMIAQEQYKNRNIAGYYNVGPDIADCVSTGALVDLFCSQWGHGLKWNSNTVKGPHEAQYLKLDCSKLKNTFCWKPRWNIEQAIEKTVEWAKEYQGNGNIGHCMEKQIREFIAAY